MRRSLTVSLFVFLFGLLSNASGIDEKRPKWVDQVPNNPEILQGIGIANDTGNPETDRKRADTDAIAQIIHEISTSVTSQLTDFYQEDSRSGQKSTQETFTKISSQFAQETITGIKIIQRYYDPQKKVYYAYAVLERTELERQFREQAERVSKICRDYHLHAQTALAAGKIYDALNNYVKALAELFIVQASLKQKIESDLELSGKKEMLQVRLENEISQILRNIYFEVISGDNQNAQRNRGLSQPLVGKAIYQLATQKIPLPNLPMRLTLVNAVGQVSADFTTDANGIFTGFVNQIESASSEIGVVKAVVNFPELVAFRSQIPALFKLVEQSGCDFKFRIDVAASVRVFVYICEDADGVPAPRAYSTGEIIKALIQNKFTVINPGQLPPSVQPNAIDFAVRYNDYQSLAGYLSTVADYAVIGMLTAEQAEVSSGVLYFSKASADIKTIDLKTGRDVVTVIQSGIKGAGNDFNTSNKAALKKCTESVVQELIKGLQSALK